MASTSSSLLGRAFTTQLPRGQLHRPTAAHTQQPGLAILSRRAALRGGGGGLLGTALLGFLAPLRSIAHAVTGTDAAAAVLQEPKWPEAFPFRSDQFER